MHDYLRRNRLAHEAAVLAEPDNNTAPLLVADDADDNNATTPAVRMPRRRQQQQHYGMWGRALVKLVEMQELDVAAGAIFILLQKCPNYIPGPV